MNRIREAEKRLRRLGASLEELEEILRARRESDRDPLEHYLAFGALSPAVDVSPTSTPTAASRPRARAFARRSLRQAKAWSLPAMLIFTLSMFGLIRLQPANTLWSQELMLSSEVKTGEFHCDPLALQFVSLTHPSSGSSTLTYALKGGGSNGPGCPEKDISNLSIPVGTCFNPELSAAGPLTGETHPGSGDSAWKYAPKNSSSPKLVKWDSKTTNPPLGGKGPFDPASMRFSFTLNVTLNLGDLADATAQYKAGPNEYPLGSVKVPKCPLPSVSQADTFSAPSVAPADEPTLAPTTDDPTPTPEPESPKAPKNGPVSVNPSGNPPRLTPTPTVTPVGVAVYPSPKH